VYIALMGQDDKQAGMAGSIGQGVDLTSSNSKRLEGRSSTAKITGLSVKSSGEFQSDQTDGTLVAGDYLTMGAAGKLAKAATGNHIIGQVTKGTFSRYVNGAVAIAGWRTGAMVNSVVQFNLGSIPAGLTIA